MDRDHALSVLQALHDAQNPMYSGGEVDAVRALLTEEIEWHVPGENAIAGDYHGIDEVLDYFIRAERWRRTRCACIPERYSWATPMSPP